MAVRHWTDLNPDRLKYEMVFARTDAVSYDQLKPVWAFAEAREVYLPLAYDEARLKVFCQKWKVARLDVFGSVLRDDFRADSDVDFLVSFADDSTLGLDFVHMADELEGIVGRKVDLLTRNSVERSPNWVRRGAILDSARPLYVA